MSISKASPKRPGRPRAAAGKPTREALLQAATRVFARDGVHAPLRAVAAEAGCTPAVVHYYFGDKQNLLEALFSLAYDDMEAQIQAALPDIGDDPVAYLRAIVREYMAALGRNPLTANLAIQEIMAASPAGMERLVSKFVQPFTSRLEGVLERGVAEGKLRYMPPPLMGVSIVGSALYYFIGAEFGRRLYGVDATDPALIESFTDRFLDLILHGISTAHFHKE